MHGHHGWGHHCGGGWGFGWFFPALILGRVLSDAFERPQQGWPYPPQPNPIPPQPSRSAQDKSQPRPAAATVVEAKAALRCQNCNGVVNSDFAFCPHCGERIAPRTCRYCGQTLQPDMAYCAHCGGPAR